MTITTINSVASITLSSDEDAIIKAKTIFDDEKKKATILKVDKTYRSRHMDRYSDTYIRSIKEYLIQVQNPESTACTWYSSVAGEVFHDSFEALKGLYWNENLLRPVQFMRALTTALGHTPLLEVIVEVGPHPALSGPASHTIQDVLQKKIPYTGLLKRGTNSINTLAEGISFL